jgi:hypothetical protein
VVLHDGFDEERSALDGEVYEVCRDNLSRFKIEPELDLIATGCFGSDGRSRQVDLRTRVRRR